ncbi:hypothetical protein CPS_1924 [Colwellia psychrerythraea 34H]|uniref:Uncharacterized protein n=1 Tax=Colwellia psychrerythraea (strain 34H / ATCC BAA-681) TaxID=167879 RepID=Q483W2_COLP3|nr:hypothetical protein CPS_1924 [Colwellia psychrerythraea 34H]
MLSMTLHYSPPQPPQHTPSSPCTFLFSSSSVELFFTALSCSFDCADTLSLVCALLVLKILNMMFSYYLVERLSKLFLAIYLVLVNLVNLVKFDLI